MTELEYPPVRKLVRGVFKGGGAKGIVYSAALHELRARGIWFSSVAGSSAGAITSMLVACGFDPVQMTTLADEAMQQVRRNVAGWVRPWGERSLLKTTSLESWLEDKVQQALGVEGRDTAVTFAELAAAEFGIELNVVALDLATQQPIVFNATTTPNCGVAAAVVASSAIPVVMQARRVLCDKAGARSVHRVVDGGAWANYPAFVYRDRSFRGYHGLEPVDASEDVVGFVIESDPYLLPPGGGQWPPPPPSFGDARDVGIVDARPAPSPFDHGSARRMGVGGTVLSWTALRWSIAVIGAAALVVLATRSWSAFAADNFAALGSLREVVRAPLIVATYMAYVGVLAFLVANIVAQVRIVGEMVENGLPSVVATMSVGPGVPSWAGYDSTDCVIRMNAPLRIETTTFKPQGEIRRMAVFVAGAQASAELDRRFPDLRRAPLPEASTFVEVDVEPQLTGERYRALGGEAVDKTYVRDGGATFAIGFWMFLLCGVAFFYAGVASVVWAIVVAAPFVRWFMIRAARGRQLNQSLITELPQRQRLVGRMLLGVLLVGFSLLMLHASEGQVTEEVNLLTVPFGFMALYGAGSIISGASRALVNRRRSSYLLELQDARL